MVGLYDTLVAVFLDVAGHYDPHYTKKIEEVCKFIETQPAYLLIRLEQFADAVAFDPLGCVRVLVRHGYLQSVSGPRKKVQGYKRGPKWPASQFFLRRDQWGLHTTSRSGSAFTSRHTSRARWRRSRVKNTFSSLITSNRAVSTMKDGALVDFPMQKATGSTSGVSVGRLIYRCAGL